MGFIAFLILGLIAGAIAKQLLPGAQGGGLLMTMLLGVVGALLGGWLGSVLFDVDLGGFFEIRTWLIAIVGSILVLVIYGFFARSRRT
ncbi:MAG: GlsB/YeaQ/YmgE family stress response membrane protein [Acidimicrobiia bacterium]